MKKALLATFIVLSPFLFFAEYDPLKKVATDLGKDLSRHNGRRIAVLTPPHHDNRRSDGPRLISERLTTLLALHKQLEILERTHIDRALTELHLKESGVLDPKTSKSLGHFLGADILITGTLIDLTQGKTELNARAIDSETGRIISASRTRLNREWKAAPRLGFHGKFIIKPLRSGSADTIQRLAKRLQQNLTTRDVSTIAIFPFLYPRRRVSTGSALVSERLITYFVNDGQTVIERRLVEKLLEEQRLSQTGAIHPDSVKEIGKILGVDAVVVGTLNDLSEKATEVYGRTIHVKTGEILSAGTVVIGRSWSDLPRIQKVPHSRSPVPMAYSPMKKPKASISKRSRLGTIKKKTRGYRPTPVPTRSYKPLTGYNMRGLSL